MDWSKGYSASYYITYVDPYTWCDLKRVEISSGSINRSTDSLRESASITCKKSFSEIEAWVRIYMNIDQNGEKIHEPLFTGLATSPSLEYNGRMESNNYECYSVLKPADDINLLRGWYVNAGSSGAEVVKELLSVTSAPISISTKYETKQSPVVKNYMIAEDGDTRLTMADKILDSINWRLRISGDGSISIEPNSKKAFYSFDPLGFDIIEPSIKVSSDWFSVPNVYCAISDGLMAIAKDENPDSQLSIKNRGREVWKTEVNVDLQEGTTIEAYAKSRLLYEQMMVKSGSYSRRYVPDIVPGDLVTLSYPNQQLEGDFYITSQSIDLGYSAKTSEEVTKYAGQN